MPWQKLVNRCKILSSPKQVRPLRKLFSKKEEHYEKLEADKSSRLVCGYPLGIDSRKTSVADESGLRGGLQLPSVLSLLFQQTCRAPALRVQHGGQSARRVLRQYQPGRSQVLAHWGSGRRVGYQQKGRLGGGIV